VRDVAIATGCGAARPDAATSIERAAI